MNMKFPSPTNISFVGFIQGYKAKRVMAVKDDGKCRRLAAFVKEALEHRSPCQDMLLVVKWKMIQMPLLDCQICKGEVRCEWKGSVQICVIWCFPNAPLNTILGQASKAGSANTCRATPSHCRRWASRCLIISCVFERGLSSLRACVHMAPTFGRMTKISQQPITAFHEKLALPPWILLCVCATIY